MKKRTQQPKNNKYYIRKAQGGLSDAILGKPTISGANVLCNCVGYAGSRFNEIINDPEQKGIYKAFKYQLVCNAENFIEKAKSYGLKISSTPVQGGIMVWQKGATLGGSDGAGHVAVVEEVYDDGSILTSESGYNAFAFKTVKRNNSNGRWSQASGYKFRGCIVNPGVKSPKVVPVPKLTVDGVGGTNTVMAMQRFFSTVQDGVISGQKKDLSIYYPALKAVEYGSGGSACIKKLQKWLGLTQDGVLGQKTVKAWQKKIGVTQDGIFGTNSMKVWQKYLNEHDKASYPTAAAAKPVASTKASQINQKALEYAWPYGTKESVYKYPSGKPDPDFVAAWKKYFPKRKINCGCHQYVMLVLKACGYPTMPLTWGKILTYLKQNFKELKVDFTQAQLKPGDIRVHKNSSGGYHIWIIVEQNGKYYRAEANQAGNKRYAHLNASTSGNTKKHKADWLFRAK